MAGTKLGGKKAAATNKAKYGQDFYARIGQLGGKLGRTGGFYANRELASEMGRKGGKISKRGPALKHKRLQVVHDEFQEGFNQPTWKDRMLNKIR
jgi:general stress protein YciG